VSAQEDNETGNEVVWSEGKGVSGLLGFDLGADDGVDRSGLRALVNSALVSHQRLPMLDVVFDRASRRISTSLRQLTNENVEVTLDNVTSARFGDFLQSQADSGVIAVMRSQTLGGNGIVAADSALVHSVVDLLLGGRRGAVSFDERALTAIELGLAQRMMEFVVADFDAAFRPVHDAQFEFDRVETTPRFAAIAQEASVCAVAKYRIAIEERSARLVILIPHAAIEPIREKLLREFFNEASGAGEDWLQHLSDGVAATGVEIAAVLADRSVTIGELGGLVIGDTLTFSGFGEPRVDLRSGGKTVASGRVGRLGAAIAIRLDGKVAGAPEGGAVEDETEAAA